MADGGTPDEEFSVELAWGEPTRVGEPGFLAVRPQPGPDPPGETDGGDDPGRESLRVRLSWPGVEHESFSAEPPSKPAASTSPAEAQSDVVTAPEASDDVGVPELVSFRRGPGPVPGADLPGSTMSLIIDAYERLGDRVLSRLRDLRGDVDADLAEMRSELASLRTAVEDVADRVQLRQMRSSIDELRSDVAGLRRAVLEWPELERVSSDVSALRASTTELQEAVVTGLHDALEAGRAVVREAPLAGEDGQIIDPDTLGVLGDELAALRVEMVALRRRIALRAGGTSAAISPEDLDAIAEAVTARLLQAIRLE